MRIGQGYDLHTLVDGAALTIGGVKIPHSKGFKAHSDGDVLVHAIIDSILGAMGEKDIGTFFPDNDPKYKGADSFLLLDEVVALVEKNGYEISNIDTTIVAEAPKMAPHIDEMKDNLAKVLKIARSQIGIKAKTNEGTDAIGRGEAIAAWAVVLLKN